MNNLGKIVTFLIGAIILFNLLYYSLDASANKHVTCGAKVFAENNTYYDLTYKPIYTSGAVLYTNTSCNVAVSNYTYTTTQVRIGSNIANNTYYMTYTYYPSMTVWGIDYIWILGIIVLVLIAVAVIYFATRY